jgi:energy-coupling factor transport system substrate-specific component
MVTQKIFYTWLKFLLIGIIAGIANNVVILPSVNFISGLYLDTIFTAAAAFSGGLVSGLISAVLTTVMYGIEYFIENGTPYFWAYYLYMLCSIAVVLLVRLFARFFPAECDNVRIIGGQGLPYNVKISQGSLFIMLAVLSVVMCIVVSIIGGLISAGITVSTGVVDKSGPPETYFRLGFIRQGFSLTVSEILARIPVNIADKPIAVFGGYGIAFLVKKIVKLRGGGGGNI